MTWILTLVMALPVQVRFSLRRSSVVGTMMTVALVSVLTNPLVPCNTCDAAGRIVITEIMYNPASDEDRGQSEWVEIANVGDAPVVMSSWRLDDEDKLPMDDWGSFTCTLAPGGVAVLVNASAVDETQFRQAWDPDVVVPSSQGQESGAAAAPGETAAPSAVVRSYVVLPVKWGGISNSPGDGNEVLRLLDADNQVMCTVALGNGVDGWPKLSQAGGPSVYLTSPWLASPSTTPEGAALPPAAPNAGTSAAGAADAPNRTARADSSSNATVTSPPGTAGSGGTAGASGISNTPRTSGASWRASSIGDAGARECRRTAIFNGRDIGSPGRIPAKAAPSTASASTSS